MRCSHGGRCQVVMVALMMVKVLVQSEKFHPEGCKLLQSSSPTGDLAYGPRVE